MQEILPDAPTGLIAAMLSEQENYLTTFTKLLVEEEEEQAKEKSKPSLSDETTCKP